uniref:Uncharacterized protein n=1 Tax=Setaria viridis TaxID=4556 RepID=A0A4U6US15_SETVI|nr:hypothetical protein SEVIR_4G007000v2 [Setaria viridis]
MPLFAEYPDRINSANILALDKHPVSGGALPTMMTKKKKIDYQHRQSLLARVDHKMRMVLMAVLLPPLMPVSAAVAVAVAAWPSPTSCSLPPTTACAPGSSPSCSSPTRGRWTSSLWASSSSRRRTSSASGPSERRLQQRRRLAAQ